MSLKNSFHVGKKKSNPFCFDGERIASRFTGVKYRHDAKSLTH